MENNLRNAFLKHQIVNSKLRCNLEINENNPNIIYMYMFVNYIGLTALNK